MASRREKLCSVGRKWKYTFNRREAKKEILDRIPICREHIIEPIMETLLTISGIDI